MQSNATEKAVVIHEQAVQKQKDVSKMVKSIVKGELEKEIAIQAEDKIIKKAEDKAVKKIEDKTAQKVDRVAVEKGVSDDPVIAKKTVVAQKVIEKKRAAPT